MKKKEEVICNNEKKKLISENLKFLFKKSKLVQYILEIKETTKVIIIR
tara:strand:- start:335 stop:478 length:144 start_codon:yes stop_codon:yes gene_type:complete